MGTELPNHDATTPGSGRPWAPLLLGVAALVACAWTAFALAEAISPV